MEDFYRGQFKKGKYTGMGKLRFKDGVYEGEFIHGHFDGYGKFKKFDGLIYKGYFQNNIFKGLSTHTIIPMIRDSTFERSRFQDMYYIL